MIILCIRLFLFIYSYGLPYVILNIIGMEGDVYNKNLTLMTFILFVFYDSILNNFKKFL